MLVSIFMNARIAIRLLNQSVETAVSFVRMGPSNVLRFKKLKVAESEIGLFLK